MCMWAFKSETSIYRIDSSSYTLELLFQYKVYHTGVRRGVRRASQRWVSWVHIGTSPQNPSCGHRAAQIKNHHRSFPHSINRQMPCVWIKVGGRQDLGAGLWVASRNPAPRAQGCPPFLHQQCLCAELSTCPVEWLHRPDPSSSATSHHVFPTTTEKLRKATYPHPQN